MRLSPRARSGARPGILADIREDLAEFGVTFDSWFSERSLSDSGAVDRAIAALEGGGHAYRRTARWWFKSTAFGDEKDRVIVRENGIKTYFASDIAFVFNKLERGFEHLLYIWGADHHGYIARLRAGLIALGGPPNASRCAWCSSSRCFRGGEKAQMSTRSGEFVTLRALREEVGNDAARLFYVMRSNDQHLDFDLELAKARSNDNPVYYIQYAHARVASVMRQMKERGIVHDPARGSRAWLARRAAGAAADQAHLRVSGNHRACACSARRIRWCTICAIWRTTSTPITARTSSSSTMRRCAMRA
jgi:arginyl-tRNA synthetase